MRSFLFSLALLPGLLIPAFAQQTDTPQSQPKTDSQISTKSASKKAQSQPTKSQETPATTEEAKPEATRESGDKSKDKEEHFDMTEVAPIVTHHQITVNGKLLHYTATTGRLPIKSDTGKIEAEMFFVAYTLDGQEASRRPLTFAFNGGPGSSSIWLHMGALGPKRVVLLPDGFMPPAPYRLEDNPYTLLDRSDLVLVDAIGTGFSRAADPKAMKKFWGVKGDIEAFGEFIRLYITRNERWTSPLYLFGESYGTTRSAGIAGYLADKGISFNGITLLSMVLNFETLISNKTNDQAFVFLVPSFTMIAGYHHKLAPDLAQDMNKAREESQRWASTEYAQALDKGDAMSPEERQKIVTQLARYTGLTPEVVDQADLRIDVRKFTHYLLIDQKLRVGRLDGRYTGPDPNGLLDTPYYDPTSAATTPPFTSVFNNYVRTELGYKTDMPYYVMAQQAGFDKWIGDRAFRAFPTQPAHFGRRW